MSLSLVPKPAQPILGAQQAPPEVFGMDLTPGAIGCALSHMQSLGGRFRSARATAPGNKGIAANIKGITARHKKLLVAMHLNTHFCGFDFCAVV